MYTTIEKHLEHLSGIDENCKVIYSIWSLNKKSLKKALSTIQITFPHYSIHDYSHADTIIQNIELFLGEERIKTLTATDSWLILMSAYTHDIGMVVFMKDLEKEMLNEGFNEVLKEKTTNRYDFDLAEAAKLILDLITEPTKNEYLDKNISYALKIKRAITILSADLFRKIHHIQSRDILQGLNEGFKNEFFKFYSHDIPARFLNVLGDIAYSHGIDFETAINLLPQKSNGYCSDYMHPRFVASMLRLGDLLDVDDKRFNHFTTKIFDTSKVSLSKDHEIKHASITHLLVTPESIEITLNCGSNENVFRIANQWFDWLKFEVDNQNRNWYRIRPEYLHGLAPSISKNKIQVILDEKIIDSDLINLQFNISKEKVFEIFEGKALYDDPSFVFLREISQNAVDATKIQMWKDIQKGVYDYIIKDHLKTLYKNDLTNISHNELLNKIKFPNDIPNNVYNNYTILLDINWVDEKKEELKIEISDRGCGIDKSTLLRMTNNVGESRTNQHGYNDFKKSLPFFLRPTGAFGLGLQSIFLVSDEFEMNTKSESDTGYNVIFRSAKNDEYISVKKVDSIKNNGTKICIRISKKNFENVFSKSFSSNELQNYDIFTDTKGSPYIYKITHYVQSNLLKQKFIQFTALSEKIFNIDNKHDIYQTILETINNFTLSKNEDVLTNMKITKYKEDAFEFNTSDLQFECYEYIGNLIGSQITLEFISDFRSISFDIEHYSPPHFKCLYAVRDLDIDTRTYSYYATYYSAIKINFLSPESDKVLNIARNKLIEKTQEENWNIISTTIIPELLIQVKEIFERNIQSLTENDFSSDSIATTYFHIELTFYINELTASSKFNQDLYNSLSIPEKIISEYDKDLQLINKLTPVDFFKKPKFFLNYMTSSKVKKILDLDDNHHHIELEQYKQAFKLHYNKEHISDQTPIIWSVSYLRIYLSVRYRISELFFNLKENYLYAKELKLKTEHYTTLKIDNQSLSAFYNYFFYKHKKSSNFTPRVIFYPINNHAKVLSVKNLYYEGFDRFPEYSNHGIISPFKNFDKFIEVRNSIPELNSIDINILKQLVRDKYLNQLINEQIITHIIKNASLSSNLNVNLVKEAYVDFISEIIIHSKSFDFE